MPMKARRLDEHGLYQREMRKRHNTGESIGSGHTIRYYTGTSTGDTRIGLIDSHVRADNGLICEGSVLFNLPGAERYRSTRQDGTLTPMWTVVSEHPLTLDPSLLCTSCGDHGFIREGKWVTS